MAPHREDARSTARRSPRLGLAKERVGIRVGILVVVVVACGAERIGAVDEADIGTEPTSGAEPDVGLDLGTGEDPEAPKPDCGFGPVTLPQWELVELLGLEGADLSVLGDLDGDGKSELLRSDTTPPLAVYLEIDGSWSSTALPEGNHEIAGATRGDINADGRLDFATIGDGQGAWNVFTVYESTEGAYEEFTFEAPLGLFGIVFVDFDDDGARDVVVAGSEGMTGSILVYRRDPDSGSYSSDPEPMASISGRLRLTAADFDGDGRDDVLVGDGIRFAGGDEMLALGVPFAELVYLTAAELTGDAAVDMLVCRSGWRPLDTNVHQLSHGLPVQPNPIADWPSCRVSGDVDDNGIADLHYRWEMRLSCGDATFSEPFSFLVDELEAFGVGIDNVRRDAALGDIDGEPGGELLVSVGDRHFLAMPRW